jgi:hypothetical protein
MPKHENEDDEHDQDDKANNTATNCASRIRRRMGVGPSSGEICQGR